MMRLLLVCAVIASSACSSDNKDPGTDGSGSTGEQGPAGPQGPMGLQGLPGIQGPTGNTGAIGAQGPQGVQGPAGDTGATGAQGPAGASVQGPIGPQGPTGAQGPVGATGPAGAKGATGAAGTAAVALDKNGNQLGLFVGQGVVTHGLVAFVGSDGFYMPMATPTIGYLGAGCTLSAFITDTQQAQGIANQYWWSPVSQFNPGTVYVQTTTTPTHQTISSTSSAVGCVNVSGGASEFGFLLDTVATYDVQGNLPWTVSVQ